jgi:hypothetical protein
MKENNISENIEQEALNVLAQVRVALGRNYKRSIRIAWENGNYSAECLGAWSSQLQQIRNSFGPSWLVRARP